MKPTPSRNLSHSEHCKRVIGWVMGAKHACTCGAEEREAERIAMMKDAARYRHLRELPPVEAQAYFWHYTSRRERDKAIDADIAKQLLSPDSSEAKP